MCAGRAEVIEPLAGGVRGHDGAVRHDAGVGGPDEPGPRGERAPRAVVEAHDLDAAVPAVAHHQGVGAVDDAEIEARRLDDRAGRRPPAGELFDRSVRSQAEDEVTLVVGDVDVPRTVDRDPGGGEERALAARFQRRARGRHHPLRR